MTSEFMDDFLNKKAEGEAKAEPEAAPEQTAQAPESGGAAPAEGGETSIKDRVVEVLQTVYDPEIPVNLYELGLIYDIDVDSNKNVHIMMTLTTPMCPVAESMPGEVEARVNEIEGLGQVTVELTWEPPWDPSKMSDEAKLELGLM